MTNRRDLLKHFGVGVTTPVIGSSPELAEELDRLLFVSRRKLFFFGAILAAKPQEITVSAFSSLWPAGGDVTVSSLYALGVKTGLGGHDYWSPLTPGRPIPAAAQLIQKVERYSGGSVTTYYARTEPLNRLSSDPTQGWKEVARLGYPDALSEVTTYGPKAPSEARLDIAESARGLRLIREPYLEVRLRRYLPPKA